MDMEKENPKERTTDPKIKEPKFSWDTGPAGGARTGDVPKTVPSVPEAIHNK